MQFPASPQIFQPPAIIGSDTYVSSYVEIAYWPVREPDVALFICGTLIQTGDCVIYIYQGLFKYIRIIRYNISNQTDIFR